ncbi:Nucleotidyl transferase possibly involved in threonylcarbamoyladenosine formation [hydrothermal vent metagenome]|uniref:Nucleotidyl transferase possibly involved in threonylcarbamoyladenosine formation n=1 Tax=hydrothermal vent metagenome TaxID=652676 RepID=A0A3B0W275_9ZZZZ
MSKNAILAPIKIKAMILAAGRGNRLRPLTDTLPKPLIPVCGKPLIEYHIEALAEAGVMDIVINHAWLGERLEAELGSGARWGVTLHYSPEPEGGLETAGGIIQALPLLGDSPFLVVNGDVYCDIQFKTLLQTAQQMASDSSRLAHLVLVPSPNHNQTGDFGLNAQQQVMVEGAFTFSGVSVLHPALFNGQPEGVSKLAPVLRKAMQKQRVTGEIYSGIWSDVGTVKRLNATEKMLGCI